MGLLDSVLSAVSGRGDNPSAGNQLLGTLSGLLAQSGGLQGLAGKFSQSGQGAAFSSWVGMGKTSRFPAIKFKKRLVPIKFVQSQLKWEWTPISPRSSWLNTCRRSSTSLRRRERWTPTSIISKGWLLYCHRSCKVLAGNLAAISPPKLRTFLPKV